MTAADDSKTSPHYNPRFDASGVQRVASSAAPAVECVAVFNYVQSAERARVCVCGAPSARTQPRRQSADREPASRRAKHRAAHSDSSSVRCDRHATRSPTRRADDTFPQKTLFTVRSKSVFNMTVISSVITLRFYAFILTHLPYSYTFFPETFPF